MKAILVVSFGTTYEETRKQNIEQVESCLYQAFPDYKPYHAYTSGMILKRLRERDGIIIPTVTEAMEQMKRDGITSILVQPTHIINGIENDLMKADILAYEADFASISFGSPLLTETEDYFTLIHGIMTDLPVLKTDEALIFMGHGTTHHSNSAYTALNYILDREGYERVHVGTVEAYPPLEEILPQLEAQNVKHVYLTPLMLVAGDHARNDLAGEDDDSWQNILNAAGYRTTCILKGLGEYNAVRQMYLEHAKKCHSTAKS